ncbi:MAG: isocitrate lyase/phosphoenolpyruvate mutase family protein [Vulcanimicrobiota bacterium]
MTDKRQRFHQLHQSGCFVLPNAWDIGTARYLEYAGFKALATTSAGLAFSRGKPDNYNLPESVLTLEEVLAHVAEMAPATKLPLNVDFQDGFAADHEELAVNVRRCAELGAAGISIEDNAGNRLYPFEEAVARVQTAVQALQGTGVLLIARAEGKLLGTATLDETIQRLRAFAAAGADCLYAPDLETIEDIQAVVQACAPKPVNVLVSSPKFTVPQLEAVGVRRISVGAALARTAWGAVMRAASEILEHGTFQNFAQAAKITEISQILNPPT